ncbi:MAG: hypothetical protein DRO67_04805 [Candidatus Asgardarchaeum californiense]|nr:MAG: hypothetical protein DRO67_04805 [Candidatus Asgardarchaeum californiense]
MLVRNVNERPEVVEELAAFLEQLAPSVAYLGIPTRPPAEPWVEPPTEAEFNRVFQLMAHAVPQLEALIGYEGNAFAYTGDIEEDILSITSVHPIREDGMRELLKKSGHNWDIVEKLISDNKIVKIEYKNKWFYIRNLSKKHI